MVTMLLAVKGIPTSRFVFVQFPTRPDPANLNKVVPDPTLAATLLQRVRGRQADLARHVEPRRERRAVHAEARTSSAEPVASSSASPSPSSISGLKGQTAAEQTCSVAASS